MTTCETVTIDSLIEQVRALIRYQGHVYYDTLIYDKFRKELQEFIFSNHFDKTEHWDFIQSNLIWKSCQFLVNEEADNIITGLENIKLKMLERKNGYKEPFWEYVHPLIINVSQKLFIDGHYADSVESALKSINSRLKSIYRKKCGNEKDGADLIGAIFSLSNPVLVFEGLETESGKNVQKGYSQIFQGAIIGIRNPSAHENQSITKDSAIKRLVFASMLMDKVDEAVIFSGVSE